jgi:uncharacterized membrane protein YeaQ/YmgE (transglycosylase-associated protein family)
MEYLGALLFGLVVGWITYRTLRRRSGEAALSDIASVVGAVGGAAVTTIFDQIDMFAWYSVGLAVGFFAYFVVGLFLERKEIKGWMVND